MRLVVPSARLLDELDLTADVEKVTAPAAIARYRDLAPGLVVDEQVLVPRWAPKSESSASGLNAATI